MFLSLFSLMVRLCCRFISDLTTESRSSCPAPAPSAAALVPTYEGTARGLLCRRGLWDCSFQPAGAPTLLDSPRCSSLPRIRPGNPCATSRALCGRAQTHAYQTPGNQNKLFPIPLSMSLSFRVLLLTVRQGVSLSCSAEPICVR